MKITGHQLTKIEDVVNQAITKVVDKKSKPLKIKTYKPLFNPHKIPKNSSKELSNKDEFIQKINKKHFSICHTQNSWFYKTNKFFIRYVG